MNGAESLLATLTNNGIDVCFTNPGTCGWRISNLSIETTAYI